MVTFGLIEVAPLAEPLPPCSVIVGEAPEVCRNGSAIGARHQCTETPAAALKPHSQAVDAVKSHGSPMRPARQPDSTSGNSWLWKLGGTITAGAVGLQDARERATRAVACMMDIPFM